MNRILNKLVSVFVCNLVEHNFVFYKGEDGCMKTRCTRCWTITPGWDHTAKRYESENGS